MSSRIIAVEPFDLVVFGGAGDLAYRKLLPALYHRHRDGQIPKQARIVGVSRRGISDAEYREAAGKALKMGRAPNALEEHWASPVAADGKVYFANNAGKVIVLKAGAQWEILAVNELGEEIFATPAIAGNRIFIRTDKSLQCFGQ